VYQLNIERIIQNSIPADVYNADGRVLFFRMAPNQIFAKRMSYMLLPANAS
jgi:hypothetical protein